MALEHIDNAPVLGDFTLLSEHQEQTPGTFFGGKAVLHLHAPASTLKILTDQFDAQPDLKRLSGDDVPTPNDAGQVVVSDIDVWVTSRNLMLYSPTQSAGLQISYPTITVTAQDGQDVLLEFNLSDADTADEDIEFLQFRIVSSTVEHHAAPAQAQSGAGTNGTTGYNDASTALFKAISDCQELNPDPPAAGEEREDGEEVFDETAPGATGWITSENMASFMDEDGNFRMPAGMTVVGGEEEEPLGEGAGRTRTAAEVDAEDGADDESKWQRTG